MRDPFTNYDSWLEQPYQDAYEAADRAEWVREHSTYATACCGAEVEYADVTVAVGGACSIAACPTCGQPATLMQEEPDMDDGDTGQYDTEEERDD
jgi:hypothetical protein